MIVTFNGLMLNISLNSVSIGFSMWWLQLDWGLYQTVTVILKLRFLIFSSTSGENLFAISCIADYFKFMITIEKQ